MTRRALSLILVGALVTGCGSTVATSGSVSFDGNQALTQPGSGDVGAGPAQPSVDGQDQLPTYPGQASGYRATSPVTGASAGTALPTPPTGTARITSPITVGMILTATTAAATFGLKLDNTYTEQQFYDGLIAALNAKGGVAGRKVKAVYDTVDPMSSNWAQDYAEACQKFTQDNHVDVVLGYSFNYDPSFEACLARKGIPHLSTTFNVPDATELRQFPLLLNVDVPTIGRRTLLKVDGAVATGVLTPRSRVGVAYDSCPGTERSYKAEAEPVFARYHVNVVSEFAVSCVTGQSDSGRSQAEVQSMALRFASQNVTHVLFHSVSEGPMMAFLMQNANSQRWYPTYVMSSLANLMFVTTNPQLVPTAQARNVKAFGWMPFEDVTVDKYPPITAPQKRCKALFRTKEIVPKGSWDYKVAYTTCEVFFILEQALAATGGVSDGPTLIRGVQGLGRSFQSVSKLGGFSAFGRERHDAVLKTRPLVWFEACECFNYTGNLRDIPSS